MNSNCKHRNHLPFLKLPLTYSKFSYNFRAALVDGVLNVSHNSHTVWLNYSFPSFCCNFGEWFPKYRNMFFKQNVRERSTHHTLSHIDVLFSVLLFLARVLFVAILLLFFCKLVIVLICSNLFQLFGKNAGQVTRAKRSNPLTFRRLFTLLH